MSTSLDEARIRIGSSQSLSGRPVFYDGVKVGELAQGDDDRYRCMVLVRDGNAVSWQYCGDAESLEAAAKLVVRRFFQGAPS